MARWVLVALLGVLAFAGVLRAEGHAPAAPGVSVTMISSADLTLDSNSPCAAGPQAAYVSFNITNTSGARLTNLSATLRGFANGIGLGGGQAASQYVGSLAAGESRVLYWYLSYTCSFNLSATLTAAVTDGTAGETTGSATVRTYSMISAQAGGVLVSGLLGPGAVVGQIIHFDVQYDFGGADVGTTYDLQPAGNPGFNAGCFQMVGSRIESSNILAVPAGTTNREYFTATAKQTGPNQNLTIRYFFKYLCANVASPTRPYSNQLSGTQLKYSSNYETFLGPTLPGATEPFDVTKAASSRLLPTLGPVTYTVTVTNPSAFDAYVDSITDVLPRGVSFGALAGGAVTAVNSGSVPAAGDTGRIVFRANPGSSYLLPRNGSLVLAYTAQVNQAGRHVNLVQARTGSTLLGTAADTVIAGTADLSVAKAGPDSIAASDTITYVLTTTNLGPHSALDVVVRDSLPAGVTFLSASRGGTLNGGVVTWPAVPTLANQGSLSDTVRVSAPVSLDSLVNRARAASPTYDASAANNDGTAAQSRTRTQVVAAIVVTPDGLPEPDARLPGTGYSQAYVVSHRGGATATYDLVARARGAAAFLVVDSIRGAGATLPQAGDSVRLPLAARTTGTYTVWYSVPAGDTARNVAVLLARATASAALADSGWAEIRRAFPALTLTRTVDPAGVLAPGTDLTYEMKFANAGSYEATGVRVTEQVPSQVFFKIGSVTAELAAGLAASVEFSADAADTPANAATTWGYAPGSSACTAPPVPAGYDGCVRRIRWTLSGPLPAGAATSTVRFVARIR